MVTLLPEFCLTPILEFHPICICLLDVSAAILHTWRQCPTSVYSTCLQLFFTPGDSVLHLFTRRVCSYSSRLETVSYICLLDVSAAILHAWSQCPTSVYSSCLQLFFTPGDILLDLFTRRVCSYSSRLDAVSYIRNSEDAQCHREKCQLFKQTAILFSEQPWDRIRSPDVCWHRIQCREWI